MLCANEYSLKSRMDSFNGTNASSTDRGRQHKRTELHTLASVSPALVTLNIGLDMQTAVVFVEKCTVGKQNCRANSGDRGGAGRQLFPHSSTLPLGGGQQNCESTPKAALSHHLTFQCSCFHLKPPLNCSPPTETVSSPPSPFVLFPS